MGHLEAILGPSWGHRGPSWGPCCAIWGPSWAILGLLGAQTSPRPNLLILQWMLMGFIDFESHLGGIWGHLGAILGHLGAIVEPACAILGQRGPKMQAKSLNIPSWVILGSRCTPRANMYIFPKAFNAFFLKMILKASWRYLGPSWGHLGPSWDHVMPSWGYSGPSWGHLGPLLGFLGRSRALLGLSCAILGHLGAI